MTYGRRGINNCMAISAGFVSHHKTLRLIDLCGGESVYALLSLWSHAFSNARNGVLRSVSPRILGGICRIGPDDGEKFTAALLEVGFLDQLVLREDMDATDWPEGVQLAWCNGTGFVEAYPVENSELRPGTLRLHDWQAWQPTAEQPGDAERAERRSEIYRRNARKRWDKN